MMKRGTPEHPKVTMLRAELQIPKYAAVGILETLFQWTASFAPAGDVGRYDDGIIAEHLGWERAPCDLVCALVRTGWLDENPDCRLVVHDWPEHCEDAVHVKLARQVRFFADGSKPKMNRLAKHERETLYEKYAQNTHKIRTKYALPMPMPMPMPMPTPTPISRAATQAKPAWSADDGFVNISETDKQSWREAYPACDIDRQLAAMHQWLLANPAKAKKKQWRRFITNWLSRQQERGGDTPSNRNNTHGNPQQRRLAAKPGEYDDVGINLTPAQNT